MKHTVHIRGARFGRVAALCCLVIAVCAGSLFAQIIVENPGGNGLNIIARPIQWSTSDGSPVDQACLQGETEIADAAGGRLCVIGTHGLIGEIQCMPPNGVFAGSGATHLMCSVCYSGTPTTISGEQGVAQCIAELQGVPCQDVVACTGPVSPMGNMVLPGGGACAVARCDGIWVNGCTPPAAIQPRIPGVCFTTGQPPSFPIPDRVTVGCFAGDLPSDVWLRCRDRYRDHVTIDRVWPLPDRTCADEWANANPTQGFQECQALVRACLAGTGRACQAAAVVE
jgi:hypothetical protein